jgi:hypothetical protein
MATSFPTGLDSFSDPIATTPITNNTDPTLNHATQHTNENDAINAIEVKLGVDGSAVTTTIDYKLKSTSSVNPGHVHTVANLHDATITSVSSGQALVWNGSAWVNATPTDTTKLPLAGGTMTGNITFNGAQTFPIPSLSITSQANGDLIYYNSGWSRLPVGSNGKILQVVSGLPSWVTPAVVLPGRQSLNFTTSSLAPLGSDTTKTMTAGNSSALLSVSASHPCCVRVYATAAAQTADSGRSQTTDPSSGVGVLFEAIFSTGGQVILVSPSAMLYSLESSPGTTVPVTVINNDNTTETITITYVILTLEQGF